MIVKHTLSESLLYQYLNKTVSDNNYSVHLYRFTVVCFLFQILLIHLCLV